MSEWTIYYNPKCGTCRKTLELLKSRDIEPRIVEYLKTPPSAADLEGIIDAVGDAHAIVRAKEEEYAAHKLSPTSSRKAIVQAIVKDPILLQRPIVVRGKRAVVARPPEEVEALF